MDWTRITDADHAMRLFPAWFSSRMVGTRGSFGLLLATGDIMRITSITAVHHGSDGTLMADVLLDHAGSPEGIDLAWRVKHYLGAPVPGATLATVNLAHVVTAVEFVAAELAERATGQAGETGDALPPELEALGNLPETIAARG